MQVARIPSSNIAPIPPTGTLPVRSASPRQVTTQPTVRPKTITPQRQQHGTFGPAHSQAGRIWLIKKDVTGPLVSREVNAVLENHPATTERILSEISDLEEIVPIAVRDHILKPLAESLRSPSPASHDAELLGERLRFVRGLQQNPAMRTWQRLTDASQTPDPNVLALHTRFLQGEVSYIMPGATDPVMVGASPQNVTDIMLGDVQAQIVNTPTGHYVRLSKEGETALIQSELGHNAENGFPAGETRLVGNGFIPIRDQGDFIRTKNGVFEICLDEVPIQIESFSVSEAPLKGVIALGGDEDRLESFGVTPHGDLLQISTDELSSATLPADRLFRGVRIEVIHSSLDQQPTFVLSLGTPNEDKAIKSGDVIRIAGRHFKFVVGNNFAELVPVYLLKDRNTTVDIPQQRLQETDEAFATRLAAVISRIKSAAFTELFRVIFDEAMQGSIPHQMALERIATELRYGNAVLRFDDYNDSSAHFFFVENIPEILRPDSSYWVRRLDSWICSARVSSVNGVNEKHYEAFTDSALYNNRREAIVTDAFRWSHHKPLSAAISKWANQVRAALGLSLKGKIADTAYNTLKDTVCGGDWDFLFSDEPAVSLNLLPAALELIQSPDPALSASAILGLIELLTPEITPEEFSKAVFASGKAAGILVEAHVLAFTKERSDLSSKQMQFLGVLAAAGEAPQLTRYLKWFSGVIDGAKPNVLGDIKINSALSELSPLLPLIWSRLQPTAAAIPLVLKYAGDTTHTNLRHHLIEAVRATPGFSQGFSDDGKNQSQEGPEAVVSEIPKAATETGLTKVASIFELFSIRPTTHDRKLSADILATLIISQSEASLRARFSAEELVSFFTLLRDWASKNCRKGHLPVTKTELSYWKDCSDRDFQPGNFLHSETPTWLYAATERIRAAALASLDALPKIEWELYTTVAPEGPYGQFYQSRDDERKQLALLFDDTYSNDPGRMDLSGKRGLHFNLALNPTLLRLFVPRRTRVAARFRYPTMIRRGMNSHDAVVLAAFKNDALLGFDIEELTRVRAMVLAEPLSIHNRQVYALGDAYQEADRMADERQTRVRKTVDGLDVFPHSESIAILESLNMIDSEQRIAMAQSGILTPDMAAQNAVELIACLTSPSFPFQLKEQRVFNHSHEMIWGSVTTHSGGHFSGGITYPKKEHEQVAKSSLPTAWTDQDTAEVSMGLEAQIVPVLQKAMTTYKDIPERAALVGAILNWDLLTATAQYPLQRNEGDWWSPNVATLLAVYNFLVAVFADPKTESALREKALEHLMNLAGETHHGLEMIKGSFSAQKANQIRTVHDLVDFAAAEMVRLILEDPKRYLAPLERARDVSGVLVMTAAAALTDLDEATMAAQLLAKYRENEGGFNLRIASDPTMASALSAIFFAGG